jgi:hypothetical protein
MSRDIAAPYTLASDAVDRQPSCQPADRLSTVSATGLDQRQVPPRQGACSARDQVQDQAADCAGADPRGSAGGRCPGVVLMDASYGCNSALRQAITGVEAALCGSHRGG